MKKITLEWIPVEEQVPNAGTWCLVTVGTGASAHVIRALYALNFFLYRGDKVDEALAWMPLPDPWIPDDTTSKGSA